MEALTKSVAREYRQRAEKLPPNSLQDIGERRKLRKELQNKYALSEVEAINVLNGFNVDVYIVASQRRIRRMEEENWRSAS